MHFIDKMLQHLLSDLKICDHTVFERPDSHDIARSTPEHSLGVGTYSCHGLLPVVRAYRNDRWLIENDALVADIDERIGCAEIYRQIVGEKSPYSFKHARLLTSVVLNPVPFL
jgi:hypothetical protein